MKTLLITLMLIISISALSQINVAVYVTGDETIDKATKQIIGSEIVAAIVKNPDYNAVERTADFLHKLIEEQEGIELTDQQIRALGQQFGVEQVCVANIMPYNNQFYIQARMLSVENAVVLATAREISSLLNLDDIVLTSEKLARRLVGVNTTNNKELQIVDNIKYDKEYSTIQYQNDSKCDIISIDNTGNNTLVSFKYITANNSSFMFSSTAYIIDNSTGNKYKCIKVDGISSTAFQDVQAGIIPFIATFEKLPHGISNITITESISNGWTWKNIVLKPYGRADYYQLEDKTLEKYKKALNQQTQAAKTQDESINKIANSIQGVVNAFTSYSLTVINSKSDQYIIQINGEPIGVASAHGNTVLRVPVNLYGTLKATQRNGYLLFPTVYTFQVPHQNIGANITIRL